MAENKTSNAAVPKGTKADQVAGKNTNQQHRDPPASNPKADTAKPAGQQPTK